MSTSNSVKTGDFDFDVSGYPSLPQLRGLFVTGTDTGVGKTLIAGAIARHLRNSWQRVEVFKPVATGCHRHGGRLISEDGAFLAACAESRQTLAEITPIRYSTAVAPNVAAEHKGLAVDLDAIFDAYCRFEGKSETVIVEGIGGLLCPISDDFWVIHLAKMMNLPLVIVARSILGTINHTLLTIHAARSAGLRVAGVVVNGYQVESGSDKLPLNDADLAICTNPQQIAQRGKVRILATVPQEEANSVEKATIGPDTQFAISQAPWERIMGLK